MTFTVRHGFSMALIEIDGLPTVLKNERIFHGELLVITRWEWWFSTGWNQQGICPWKLTWPAQQFRRSRRGWCGVLKGITGIIHSCTTNPPWINPKKIPINPPNHHQLSSRYIYIYSSNATPGPFQLHPMVNDHPCKNGPRKSHGAA